MHAVLISAEEKKKSFPRCIFWFWLKVSKSAVQYCSFILQSLAKQGISCSAKANHKVREYKKYILNMLQLVQHKTLFCCSCYYLLFSASSFWMKFSTRSESNKTGKGIGHFISFMVLWGKLLLQITPKKATVIDLDQLAVCPSHHVKYSCS